MRALRFLAGFLEIHAPQSMTRLIALLCGIAVYRLSSAAVYLASRPHLLPVHVEMVKTLAGFATVLLVNGAAALLLRSRATNVSPSVSGSPPVGGSPS